jgi:hypothetical protein
MVTCVTEHNAETRSINVVHIYCYINIHLRLVGIYEEFFNTMHGTKTSNYF